MGAEAEPMARARELFKAGELHSAMEAAQVAAERAPRNAETWSLLARITHHVGLLGASDQAFRRAAALSRRRPAPHRVTPEQFRDLVSAAQAHLSPDARRRLAETEIAVEPLPAPEAIREGVDPDAPARRIRRPSDRLVLFQVNLENRSASAEELRALLVRTLSRA